ncbi:MAG: VOC family protein, partial [Chloroflexota bacterium]|nr:VOC family protein [Chloroflexota bacterium]
VHTDWWRRFQAGEGFIDYALRTDDLAIAVERLRAAGLDVPDPRTGGRTRPDGQRVEWRNLEFGPGSSGSLPFYCHSTNDRSLRVPFGEAAVHSNGVTGVAGITIVVDDLEAAAHDYAGLTGMEGQDLIANARDTGRGRRFDIGSATGSAGTPARIHLDLVTAAIDDSNLGRVVAERGEVPVMVTLSGDGGVDRTIDPDLTHGAVVTIA